jgi:hypothetical protein
MNERTGVVEGLHFAASRMILPNAWWTVLKFRKQLVFDIRGTRRTRNSLWIHKCGGKNRRILKLDCNFDGLVWHRSHFWCSGRLRLESWLENWGIKFSGSRVLPGKNRVDYIFFQTVKIFLFKLSKFSV